MSINVTQTFFPPIEEYQSQIQRIWDNRWLTNRGALVLELEEKLKAHLAIPNITITNNGTIPLQIALKIVGGKGEIITTPFSYVATMAAIIWEDCKPIFVDIDEDHWTIDESKIESAITPNTTAILATHVFGNPCNVNVIESIAKKHNLKVIYDAAHAFGVKYFDKSIFEFGDISTCSFHATKLFHTGEGGAIICKDTDLNHKLYYSHNFGHNGPLAFWGLGINGKISELQAAMGLAVFPYISDILSSREQVVKAYDSNLDFSKIKKIKIREGTEWNYSYYPVIFKNEEILLKVQTALNNESIFPRRYFYPSLNTIDYANGGEMPISESIASKVLCLPLYAELPIVEVERIVKIINSIL